MPRLLLVEDEPHLQELYQQMLSACGWEWVGAWNGRVALERLPGSEVVAVLTDIAMPEMDGLELITRLRAQYPGLPIIAMSGSSSGGYLSLADRLGAVRSLRKPFSLAELQGTLEAVAALAGAQRRA